MFRKFLIAAAVTASTVSTAFAHVGLDWSKHVVVDPQYFRPTEVDILLGDASKAKRAFGWEPTTRFEALVKLMVDADIEALASGKLDVGHGENER